MQTPVIFNHSDLIQFLDELDDNCNLKIDFKYFNSEEFKAECKASQPMVDRIMRLLQQIDDALFQIQLQFFKNLLFSQFDLL